MTDIVSALLGAGAKVDVASAGGSWTPTIAAANSRSLKVARLLAQADADFNTPNCWGEAPLNSACSVGHDAMVEWLCRLGVDTGSTNNACMTPFASAVIFGRRRIARFLHSVDADHFCVAVKAS